MAMVLFTAFCQFELHRILRSEIVQAASSSSFVWKPLVELFEEPHPIRLMIDDAVKLFEPIDVRNSLDSSLVSVAIIGAGEEIFVVNCRNRN